MRFSFLPSEYCVLSFWLYEQENVKDKDVEEELSPVPITITTVELEVILDDGESGVQVWVLFRTCQTARDIRNTNEWFKPEDKRDYYLKSDTVHSCIQIDHVRLLLTTIDET